MRLLDMDDVNRLANVSTYAREHSVDKGLDRTNKLPFVGSLLSDPDISRTMYSAIMENIPMNIIPSGEIIAEVASNSGAASDHNYQVVPETLITQSDIDEQVRSLMREEFVWQRLSETFKDFQYKKRREENHMYDSVENPSLNDLADLAFVKPISDRVYSNKKFVIIVVGVGGTGGYVVRDLSRFLYSITSRTPEFDIKMVLVDPDLVEEKNLLRQNFLPGDKGKNKAEVMAARHSRAFSLEISSVPQLLDRALIEKITSLHYDYTPIIVGCVDNNKARREIHTYIEKNSKTAYWIDSGNERTSGQVILGSKQIPTVTRLFPEVMESTADTTETISCAERLMQDEQNIFVNVCAATHVLNFIRTLVLNETGMIHGVRFNISGKVDNFCLKEAGVVEEKKTAKRKFAA